MYLNKLRKGKDPRPFFSHLTITNVPFVSCKNYTEDEIIDAIDSFRKYGLIRPINEVFSDEIRFDHSRIFKELYKRYLVNS